MSRPRTSAARGWVPATMIDECWNYDESDQVLIRAALALNDRDGADALEKKALEKVTRLAQEYRAWTPVFEAMPTPGAVRDTLDGLARQCSELRTTLTGLDELSLFAMIEASHRPALHLEILDAAEVLHRLSLLATIASQAVDPRGGRPARATYRGFICGLVDVWRQYKGEPPRVRDWELTPLHGFLVACVGPLVEPANLSALIKQALGAAPAHG